MQLYIFTCIHTYKYTYKHIYIHSYIYILSLPNFGDVDSPWKFCLCTISWFLPSGCNFLCRLFFRYDHKEERGRGWDAGQAQRLSNRLFSRYCVCSFPTFLFSVFARRPSQLRWSKPPFHTLVTLLSMHGCVWIINKSAIALPVRKRMLTRCFCSICAYLLLCECGHHSMGFSENFGFPFLSFPYVFYDPQILSFSSMPTHRITHCHGLRCGLTRRWLLYRCRHKVQKKISLVYVCMNAYIYICVCEGRK